MCPGILKNKKDCSSRNTGSQYDIKLCKVLAFSQFSQSKNLIGLVNQCQKKWGTNLFLRDVSGAQENQFSGPNAIMRNFTKSWSYSEGSEKCTYGKSWLLSEPEINNKCHAAGGSSLWSTNALGRTGTETRQQTDLKIIENNHLCLELNSQWIKLI